MSLRAFCSKTAAAGELMFAERIRGRNTSKREGNDLKARKRKKDEVTFELQVSSSVPNSVASNNCTPQNGGTAGAGTTASGFGGGRVNVMGAEQRPPELQYRAG
ncbi:unnamed protein product [Amoebophrya sp. A120]|nr:unnamed protein product [Amoebophrya sp. A120]|eukprot:GSA120T00006964001.1